MFGLFINLFFSTFYIYMNIKNNPITLILPFLNRTITISMPNMEILQKKKKKRREIQSHLS